ncbi:MAG: DGQHR domain-containing protein [Proteobacteria bacterium]|nr:DGQHR domain-containing protein [Pseudomonadota bacterium]
MSNNFANIHGKLGLSGGREVFIGFASSSLLSAISIADVLDESTGKGYQRPINNKHSLDFRKFIQQPGAATIPLTFNLRPRKDDAWTITSSKSGDKLAVNLDVKNIMYQVDCQHRLGFLSDLSIDFPFMAFVGLSQQEEMRVFNTINGKAKGLSSSLLDFHEAKLVKDIENIRPELVISIKLTEDELSPWYKQLNLGGKQTIGVKRRASLRTMQKAVKRFLKETSALEDREVNDVYEIVRCFWQCVAEVVSKEWSDPRKHMINKGIGVYSLMSVAADLYVEGSRSGVDSWERYFAGKLSDFMPAFDWSSSGTLKGLGGEAGVAEAVEQLRKFRSKAKLKVV